MPDNKGIIRKKSYNFALRILNLFKYLKDKKKEYVLSKQILRSATPIGANVEEASASLSKREFISKFSIAYKEVKETQYWLELLKDGEYLSLPQYNSLANDCEELAKIICKIQKTTKKNIDY